MNKFASYSRGRPWFMALLLSGLLAACGGGNQDPILGGDVATLVPSVTAVTPLAGATAVPINTKVITAAFNKAMDATTLTASSFTLSCPGTTAVAGAVVSFAATGNVATLTLPTATNLPASSLCTASVTTAAKDTFGLTLASNFSWSFTTGPNPDTTPPTVTGTTHVNGATGVAINAKATATFSEAMDATTLNASNFTLKQGSTAVAGTVTYLGVTATFAPSGNLALNTSYTVTIKGGASGVKDAAGNAMANDFVITWTTGATTDTTAPTVTGTVHANGATNVALNTKVGATFSEAIDPLTMSSVTFSVKEAVSGTAVAGTVNYSGVTAVFAPSSNLTSNTRYTVTVKGGANGVKDLAGNAMAADFVISWTTGTSLNTSPPTVSMTFNANGASNVSTNARVGAIFSEEMDPLSVTNQTFTMKETVSGNDVPGVVVFAGVTTVYSFNNSLLANTRYTLTIKGGTAGVKDLAGNAMVADFIWSWTTAVTGGTGTIDTTAPTVSGTVNANGATNVPVNSDVGAMFSEPMNPLTITNQNFTVKESVSGVALAGTVAYVGVTTEFKPLSAFAANTRYTGTIKGAAGGVADLAGNVMVSDYTWSWTTGGAGGTGTTDTTAPTVTGTIQANGATGVAVNTTVGATFSEAMQAASTTNLNFTLSETSSGNAVTGTVAYSGVNATFIPLGNLANNTNYTVRVKGGVGGVKDLAGNAMVSDFVITWTTGGGTDSTAPTVTLVNPANLATNVAVNSSVNATFSEAMDPLSLNTASFSVAGVTGLVSYNAASKIATFSPSSNLAANTLYTATVSTSVKDLAGNTLANNKVWSFTTGTTPVVPPPSVNLGSAATYGTFGGTAGMTNMGTLTQINGNIGTTATGTSSITGFHDTAGDIYTQTTLNSGAVNGLIYTCTHSTTGPTSAGVNAPACALATQARLDAQTAYLALVAMPPGANPGANLAGLTLAPGVYTSPSGSFLIEGADLTLDAQGDANAVFVFQMATTLTVGGPGAAAPRSIILAGGAQAKNVFWQVGSFATINAAGGGTMVGNILAQSGVSFSTAGNVNIVTLNGRALSLGASVTLVNTVINMP